MKTLPRWRPVIPRTMSSSSRSRSTAATGRCGQAGSRREVANVADWTFDEGLVHSQRRTRTPSLAADPRSIFPDRFAGGPIRRDSCFCYVAHALQEEPQLGFPVSGVPDVVEKVVVGAPIAFEVQAEVQKWLPEKSGVTQHEGDQRSSQPAVAVDMVGLAPLASTLHAQTQPVVLDSAFLAGYSWCNRRRALRDKIADAVVAFANADEGLPLVGVGRQRHCDRTRLLRQACGRTLRSAPPQADARSRLPLRAPLARLHEILAFEVPVAPEAVMIDGNGCPYSFPLDYL